MTQSFFFFCTATGIRIRVAGMKIQDPNQLDDRRMCKAFCFFSSGRGIRTLDFQAMKSEELPLLYPAMLVAVQGFEPWFLP